MQPDGIQIITDFFQSITLFVGRPVVQRQLIAIAISLVVTYGLSEGLTYLINKPFTRTVDRWFSGRFHRYTEQLLISLDQVTFPLMGVVTLYITQVYIFMERGWFAGLIGDVILLYWTILIYRLFIAVLYQLFSLESVQRYHYRLLAPIFYLFLTSQVLTYFIDLSALLQVTLVELSDGSPIVIGGVLLATVGLYLWVETVWGIRDIIKTVLNALTTIDRGVVEGLLAVSSYILIGVGLFIALNNLGLDSTTIAAVTGGLSVGVGFALQDVLKNFLGGILLLFEGSMRPGDVVDINGTLATVDKLNIRSTTIRTFNDTEIIIPNQNLVSSSVTTYTGSDKRLRLVIEIGTSYNSNPRQVIEILQETARHHELVLTSPAPKAMLTEFADSSINFILWVWVDNLNFGVKPELHLAIWDAFEKNGIEIPFPQQDVHIRSTVEGKPAV